MDVWQLGLTTWRLLKGLPYLRRRQRHLKSVRSVGAAGADESVDDGVDDRRRGADRAELADSFDAERIVPARRASRITRSRKSPMLPCSNERPIHVGFAEPELGVEQDGALRRLGGERAAIGSPDPSPKT